MAVSCGKLAEATDYYGQGLEIRKQLAAGDPTNTGWQRDLWVLFWRLADLSERQNKDAEAKDHWKKAFAVLQGIEKQSLHLSPQDQQSLETIRRKVGESFSEDSSLQSGRSN